MRTLLAVTAALCVACAASPTTDDDDTADTDDGTRPWSGALPVASEVIAPLRGRQHARAVFHLHSPWSHDACDSKGWEDGVLDEACLSDLRGALCTLHYDAAFLTDHPDHGDAQSFVDLFHPREGDTWVREDGKPSANVIDCPDGHPMAWRAGFEDDLMPVGLRDHVDPDPATRHDLLNRSDAEALGAMKAVGGTVLVAHTEGRDQAWLERLQDDGLHGIEVFNLHAMFAPDIRSEDLGLDGLGWAEDLGPFVDADDVAEPDLFFLAVHGAQPPSEQAWDALLARGPMMATAGVDAHQNVLAAPMKDGERGDSYRRMLRWLSTMLVVDTVDVEGVDEALAARRAFVVFEALGTPTGFDVHVDTGSDIVEMGGEGSPGELVVACPELSDPSPRGAEAPEITVSVLKDGQPWQEGCGRWDAGPGVYRVRVDVVPHHLADFLGPRAAHLVRAYPWIYSGAIRIGE